jgi:pyrroline-5-carboxylate reductase
LLRAFLEQKLVQPKRVHATVRHAEKARSLAKQLGITASTDNRAAVHGADIILLAVKPQVVKEVLEEIKPEMKPGKLIVSVVASVSTHHGKAAGDGPSSDSRHAEHALRDWLRHDRPGQGNSRGQGSSGNGASDV